jgi:hypothetical protein
VNEPLNATKLKALRKAPVTLSRGSQVAVAKFDQLYRAGSVFVENECEVRRDPDVYMAACALADALGQDLAAHIGFAASGHTKYTIIFNLRIQFQTRIGPGRCAVGAYDFDAGICTYEGIVAC